MDSPKNMDRAIDRYKKERGATAYRGKYDRSWVRRIDNRREHSILEALLNHFNREASLLNIPCGAGRFGEVILSRTRRTVFADLSLPMVRLSKKYLGSLSTGIYFSVSDSANLPFSDMSFELVLSIRLLHHLHDKNLRDRCLSELFRVSNRWAIVTFADSISIKGMNRRFRQRWFGRKKGEAMMSRKEFAEISYSLGYRVIRFVPISRLFSTQTYALLERLNQG